MSNYYGSDLDRSLQPRPGECGACCGTGTKHETLDDDRYPVEVPCDKCKGTGKRASDVKDLIGKDPREGFEWR